MKKITSIIITMVLTLAMVFGSMSMSTTEVMAKTKGKKINVVSVEGGLVKGVQSDEKGVTLFKGIPYAGSTAGENRWKEPQPVESWKGVKVCDTWGDQVMQQANLNPVGTFWGDEFYYDDSYTPNISENGLNLNIYTPAKYNNEKLPVLVWIHGGGNNHGHASEIEFNASQLAEKGIIVVEVQYRVSMFGFLALDELTEEQGASGNYAVLDLVKSLQWVNEYIDGFGGDPNEVTIAGQSAGAMNVTALLRTPLAKGLFNRVIIQSGFSGLLVNEGAAVYGTLEAKEKKCEEAITKAFGKEMSLKELRSLSAEYYMTEKTADGTSTLYNALTSAASGYVIDGYVFTEDSVDLSKDGALNGIDIMIGGASDEMTSLAGGENSTMDLERFATSMSNTYGEAYKEAYAPTNETEAYRLNLRASSDSAFQKYIISAEYAKAHNSNLNVYTYYFNQELPGRNSEFYGAFHSSELWYMFSSLRNQAGQRDWTKQDYKLADTMSSYWANFVKNGNPNGCGLTKWKECKAATDGAFVRFANGKAECVTRTPYAARDEINFAVNLKNFGLAKNDLGIKSQISFENATVTLDIKQSYTQVASLISDSANKNVRYTSSNAAVATVNAKTGKVVARKAGSTKITAYALDGSGVKASYTIYVKPGKVTLKSVTAKKKCSVTASWKKVKDATGYQVYLSTTNKSEESFKKVKTTTKETKLSYTGSELEAGKVVYVKVRAYKKVGTTKLYGDFSEIKKVTLKKR